MTESNSITYFPAITIRDAEIRALSQLAGPTKDRMYPIVRIQAWPRSKKGYDTLIGRSVLEYQAVMGARRAAIDLAEPRTDKDSEDGLLGKAEMQALCDPAGGFENWVNFVTAHPQFDPVLQWGSDAASVAQQLLSLQVLDRGIVIRLRRSQGWDAALLQAMKPYFSGDRHILVLLDCEQLDVTDNLGLLAAEVQKVATFAQSNVSGLTVSYVVLASSFPIDFSAIHKTGAKLTIRERQLYGLLKDSPGTVSAGISLRYGDYGSVYAIKKPPAFRGLPRVDYPTPTSWLYQRRPWSEGFGAAAKAIVNENEWNEELLCWGTMEIRRAADGNLNGLNAPNPWTAVRINIHLHQQAHYDEGGANVIEEPWED